MPAVARKLKHKKMEERLLALIEQGSLKDGDALCGERELCLRFGVSRNTVRSAIEELESRGLLERIPGKGTFVRRGKTEAQDIGILIPGMDYFYPAAIQGAARALRKEGLRLVVGASDDDAKLELELLTKFAASREIAGVIVGATTNCNFKEALKRLAGKPAVFIDHAPASIPCDCILSDHFKGGYEATKALLALGHVRIACAGNSEEDPACWVALRAKGYAKALQDAGLAFDRKLSKRGKWFETCADSEFVKFFKNGNPPTAIFATNDRTASIAMARLREKGIAVPGEVAVIGYDDEPFATTLRPKLASMATPKEEIGEKAALRLIEKLKGESSSEPIREMLAPSLARRASMGSQGTAENMKKAS